MWELFPQIGQAERELDNEASRYLVSRLESDPTGINHIRRRDESGIILPLDLGARLHLLQQLNVFARQGTLFDADDMPNDAAQPTFERFGFYASDIYPFLARNDVAVSRPDDEGSEGRVFPDGRCVPSWILAYDGHAWLSRSRAAKILIAGTKDADLWPPQYDEVFFKWDEALADAIDRDAITVTKIARKQMLSHTDISAWCAHHDYVWPLTAPDAQSAAKLDATPAADQPGQRVDSAPRGPRDDASKLSKRERQISVVEEMADKLGYQRLQVPDGGQTAIRKLCNERTDLFSGGYEQFRDVWKDAVEAGRIRMANHNRFARK
ncbi:protein of unknown function [Ralstonia solanacearum CMR15]|nr:protein of unknown function [Ralstonia solanacearum CMR15]